MRFQLIDPARTSSHVSPDYWTFRGMTIWPEIRRKLPPVPRRLRHERVLDETPQGHLPLQKKAVQILRDVTRRTSQRIVANVIRGVMADRPHFHRIGIICHHPHIPAP